MIAVGLAVAIPAVLAYNSFSRSNRIWLAQMDGFARDLYTLVTVGLFANGDQTNEKKPILQLN